MEGGFFAGGQQHCRHSLSFHSPTLAVGHTPYAKNGTDLARFWDWWDAIFKAFDRLGVKPVRYDALADALCGVE